MAHRTEDDWERLRSETRARTEKRTLFDKQTKEQIVRRIATELPWQEDFETAVPIIYTKNLSSEQETLFNAAVDKSLISIDSNNITAGNAFTVVPEIFTAINTQVLITNRIKISQLNGFIKTTIPQITEMLLRYPLKEESSTKYIEVKDNDNAEKTELWASYDPTSKLKLASTNMQPSGKKFQISGTNEAPSYLGQAVAGSLFLKRKEQNMNVGAG